VFNLFDINGGGTIDADELDVALRTVDIHLNPQEIHDVLHVIDEDGMQISSYYHSNDRSQVTSFIFNIIRKRRDRL
jgi:Ca2+-binding EF-hand superfamily protein